MATRFVVLASMRTGSNLLNSKLNQFSGIICHGEAFNPTFVGLEPKFLRQFGLERTDMAERDRDPEGFLSLLFSVDAQAVGLHLFPGHNRAILHQLVDDAEVKKICLRRSLFHSFISWQVARKTDVWRVTTTGTRKELTIADRQIIFKPEDFESYRARIDGFWTPIFKRLNKSGQEFFPVWYREIGNVSKLNQIAAFLGLSERKASFADDIVRQNPESPQDLVLNWDEMVDYARSINLHHQL